MYECTVSGNGATIWTGTAFDCSSINNEFTIFHSTNDTSEVPKYCSNGAIIGRTIGPAENDSYTSRITIQVSNEFNGKTAVCVHDDGTNFIEIGSAMLNITTRIIQLYTSIITYALILKHSSISSAN
jgi:hypothetical protein